MGKLLITAAGLIMGTGILALTAAGSANALAASSGSACGQVQATLSSIQATLPSAASNPAALKTKIGAYASKLQREASSGSPALKSAVGTFIADLRAVASGKANVPKLKADANAIGVACQASAAPPSGAPGTGGGSTAGLATSTPSRPGLPCSSTSALSHRETWWTLPCTTTRSPCSRSPRPPVPQEPLPHQYRLRPNRLPYPPADHLRRQLRPPNRATTCPTSLRSLRCYPPIAVNCRSHRVRVMDFRT